MAIGYSIRWAKEMLVKDFIAKIAVGFIFENIISRFGCPKILTSDQGMHFINATIKSLLENFMVQHHKRNPYHPQANGTVEEFNSSYKRA